MNTLQILILILIFFDYWIIMILFLRAKFVRYIHTIIFIILWKFSRIYKNLFLEEIYLETRLHVCFFFSVAFLTLFSVFIIVSIEVNYFARNPPVLSGFNFPLDPQYAFAIFLATTLCRSLRAVAQRDPLTQALYFPFYFLVYLHVQLSRDNDDDSSRYSRSIY